ncbi:MAG TPA: hypothetical protein VIN60_07815 [Anaerolineales bacterium]
MISYSSPMGTTLAPGASTGVTMSMHSMMRMEMNRRGWDER